MHIGAAFLLGLGAGGISCGVVQGSLLAGLAARRGRDTVPSVVEFLTGKLVSHVVVGGLLGAVGAVLIAGVWMRAAALILAGVAIMLLALTQLQLPGLRWLAVDPPQSWVRLVRGRAQSASRFAALGLGFATILIPCGATIAAMALAATSGSLVAGAGTLGAFVVGTVPLFTVVGLTTGALRAHRRRWPNRTIGVVVLACGLWAVNSGLLVAGSPLAVQHLAATTGVVAVPAADARPVTTVGGAQTGVITVRSDGFSPSNLALGAGRPTRLTFRAVGATGCIRSVVIPRLGIQVTLPESGSRTIDLGTTEPGRIDYTCAMGMYSGSVTVR